MEAGLSEQMKQPVQGHEVASMRAARADSRVMLAHVAVPTPPLQRAVFHPCDGLPFPWAVAGAEGGRSPSEGGAAAGRSDGTGVTETQARTASPDRALSPRVDEALIDQALSPRGTR